MAIKRYSSQGVVLERRNYSEADRVLVVLSKHWGKISLLAKGVRKLKSRKRGAVEVFSNIKFSASKTKGMDIVTEVEAIDTYNSIRKDLKKVSVAFFLVEIVNKLLSEGEENDKVYNLLTDYLAQLSKAKNLKIFRQEFAEKLLVMLGFWPKNKKIVNIDNLLESITERQINSIKVGKRVLN